MLAQEKNKYQQIWKETRSSTPGNDKTKNHKHTPDPTWELYVEHMGWESQMH